MFILIQTFLVSQICYILLVLFQLMSTNLQNILKTYLSVLKTKDDKIKCWMMCTNWFRFMGCSCCLLTVVLNTFAANLSFMTENGVMFMCNMKTYFVMRLSYVTKFCIFFQFLYPLPFPKRIKKGFRVEDIHCKNWYYQYRYTLFVRTSKLCLSLIILKFSSFLRSIYC